MLPWPLAGLNAEFLINNVSRKKKDPFINLRYSNLSAYEKGKKAQWKVQHDQLWVFFTMISHITKFFNSDK